VYAELQLTSSFYASVGNMSTKVAMHFVRLLEDDDSALDNLLCVAFR
jgi:hypothetical protein